MQEILQFLHTGATYCNKVFLIHIPATLPKHRIYWQYGCKKTEQDAVQQSVKKFSAVFVRVIFKK